ncbi:MAG: hypothetical protein IJG13_13500 [Kiritimatiellae bacterium]|nr:hypothetical protein [Kiritimatiellia bacterium]
MATTRSNAKRWPSRLAGTAACLHKEIVAPGSYCTVPICGSELDLSDDICESERSLEAFEELVNNDAFMERRFAAICDIRGGRCWEASR